MTNSDNERRMPMAYRVIQWYTGFVAQEQIRLIHRHPELELVGAVVFHQEKEGLDAGEIAGIGPIGIRATTDIEKVLSIKADCVLYNAPWERYDEITRILESGKNVVTLNGGWYPKTDPDMMNRLEEACKAGGSSLIGSGVSPGWAGDLVALIASSQCSEIRRIHHLEVGDLRGYDPLTLGVMGFGKTLKELPARCRCSFLKSRERHAGKGICTGETGCRERCGEGGDSSWHSA